MCGLNLTESENSRVWTPKTRRRSEDFGFVFPLFTSASHVDSITQTKKICHIHYNEYTLKNLLWAALKELSYMTFVWKNQSIEKDESPEEFYDSVITPIGNRKMNRMLKFVVTMYLKRLVKTIWIAKYFKCFHTTQVCLSFKRTERICISANMSHSSR